jgi:hypothetical protein
VYQYVHIMCHSIAVRNNRALRLGWGANPHHLHPGGSARVGRISVA